MYLIDSSAYCDFGPVQEVVCNVRMSLKGSRVYCWYEGTGIRSTQWIHLLFKSITQGTVLKMGNLVIVPWETLRAAVEKPNNGVPKACVSFGGNGAWKEGKAVLWGRKARPHELFGQATPQSLTFI